MPYHLEIHLGDSPLSSLAYDELLGSAHTVSLYWEQPAEMLGLQTIVGMIDRADSENGFTVIGEDLSKFREELIELLDYWESNLNPEIAPSNQRLASMKNLVRAIDAAINATPSLIIG